MFSIKLVPYINLVKITDEVCFIRRNGADHKLNQINCSYMISVTNAHITRELKSTTALVTCNQSWWFKLPKVDACMGLISFASVTTNPEDTVVVEHGMHSYSWRDDRFTPTS